METGDGTSNSDNAEHAELDRCLSSRAVNNRVAIADGGSVTQDKEVCHLKNEDVNNRMAMADGFAIVEGQSGRGECLQTYKRRKHSKIICPASRVQEEGTKCVEDANLLSDQAVKKPCDVAVGNTSKDYSNGHWGNVVLKRLYHSLDNDNNGIGCCIREAMMNPKTTRDTQTSKIDKDSQECSSQIEWFSHRLQSESNEHADIMHDGCSSESDGCGVTKKCRRVFCNILASEKFSSLCMVLFENFQGMKPESVFDFGVINSRMKEQGYEQSPTLFLSDIEQVWRKLQDTGNEIVTIAKSLSSMSRASYCEHVGVSADNSFEDGKQVFCSQALDFDTEPQQTGECVTNKFYTCRHCGGKADATDCLICDSCEEMYHVSCIGIEPDVKEIHDKSWFCANCTAIGIGSPHDNCVVCERLYVPESLNNTGGEESKPTNDETLNELEENSNCTSDGIQVSIGGRNSPDCKICGEGVNGEQIKKCGHSLCPNKYYHVRCLSSKQLKSHGACWYCPSCLCGVCLKDKDDHKIVLCDGCNDAYHIYCMEPRRTSIPRGKWFCRKCDAGIQAIHLAKKVYANNKRRAGDNVSISNDKLDKRWKKREELDKDGGMDMLLTAANTLNYEENFATGHIESQRI